jgi:hypothetical protein
LIHRVETSTGVRSTDTLTLTPQVLAAGSLDGLPLHTTFAPAIGFSLNQLELQPTVAAGGASGGQIPASAFSPSAGGTAIGRHSQAMRISFGLLEVPVATAREIALGGIALVACTVGLLLALARPRRRDESAAIRARYGGLIIPVERVWQQPGVAVIDVADIEALVRIAAHYDRSILHELTGYGEAFWVTDESGQFRYWIGTPDEQPDEAPAVVTELTEPDAPTLTLELPNHREQGAGEAPTLEFSLHAGGGVAQSRSNGWEFAGPSESVEHVEAPPGVEPGPAAG